MSLFGVRTISVLMTLVKWQTQHREAIHRRVESENLNLRNQLNRKILGYSKLAEIHDKIIATFIENEHYV
jgi:IS1 family transposase